MAFDSVQSMLAAAEASHQPLWRAIMLHDAHEQGLEEAASWQKMRGLLKAMIAADQAYDSQECSASGLSGGAAAKISAAQQQGRLIGDSFLSDIIAGALRMAENNACMKRIVAAPTAGSCGVLPALLLAYMRRHDCSEQQLIEALYIAAGFGQVIAMRASISGAEGGCQAEIGAAAAMAAPALVHLHGGSPQMMAEACAMAIKNLLGLVCDPVAGLVEAPCVKRNVIGAMDALSAAEMALAGITSAIPVDEVLDAMYEVGLSLPAALRETGTGGLANTPTGKAIRQQIQGLG